MNKFYKTLLLLLLSSLMIYLSLPQIQSTAAGYPEGSYKDSCRNIVVIGHMLEAQCRAKDGSWNNSLIYTKMCKGNIVNNNGNLACDGKPVQTPPAGSYQDSCKEINVSGDILKAKCQRRDGGWQATSILFTNCYGDIANQNGTLICAQRHHNSYLPNGSYKETCNNLQVNGNILRASCRKKDGSWDNTSIDFKHCYGEIANLNGTLVCR